MRQKGHGTVLPLSVPMSLRGRLPGDRLTVASQLDRETGSRPFTDIKYQPPSRAPHHKLMVGDRHQVNHLACLEVQLEAIIGQANTAEITERSRV